MGALNKSFLLGTAVASITWCISLYLYWILVHNTDTDIDASTMVPRHSPYNSINDLSPHIEKSFGKDISKQHYLDKVQRYKKEQKLKKISRKLIDELQPIVPVANGNFEVERFTCIS